MSGEREQGELFGQRAKRSSMANPRVGRGDPPATPPGRRGAQFVADPTLPGEAEKRKKLTAQLESLALVVGKSAGAKGFALWEVRHFATEAGILTGEEGTKTNPRELAWLGALLPGMARRGLVEKVTIDGRPQYDTSHGERAHGNKNVLWKITPDGRAALEAGTNWVDFKYWTGEPGVDL